MKSSRPNAWAAICAVGVPGDGCISMVRQDHAAGVMTWEHHPNNPLRKEGTV